MHEEKIELFSQHVISILGKDFKEASVSDYPIITDGRYIYILSFSGQPKPTDSQLSQPERENAAGGEAMEVDTSLVPSVEAAVTAEEGEAERAAEGEGEAMILENADEGETGPSDAPRVFGLGSDHSDDSSSDEDDNEEEQQQDEVTDILPFSVYKFEPLPQLSHVATWHFNGQLLEPPSNNGC